jgi:hypothetical protein
MPPGVLVLAIPLLAARAGSNLHHRPTSEPGKPGFLLPGRNGINLPGALRKHPLSLHVMHAIGCRKSSHGKALAILHQNQRFARRA